MKRSPALILAVAIAAVALAGAVGLALAVDGGAAPASGQKVFDAPGCLPRSYDGPGSRPRYQLSRNCPRPTAVIVAQPLGKGRVLLNGDRSFDSLGGKIVSYGWDLGHGRSARGPRVVVHYPRPGPHSVVLEVTDDSGIPSAIRKGFTLP